MDRDRLDVDPEIQPESAPAEDEEDSDSVLAIVEDPPEPLPAAEHVATGALVIREHARLAPTGPGVYRMLDGKGDVLYVGKAKNVQKRVSAYTREYGLAIRTTRMIAATASMEFISTATETEALLLEANLIKRFRPRFNVLLRRQVVSLYPDHQRPRGAANPQASRRAQSPGRLFRPVRGRRRGEPYADGARAPSCCAPCSNSFYESRTRPCLLFQIKRCSAPCTGEISYTKYNVLVAEARFLSRPEPDGEGDAGEEMEEERRKR